MLLKLNTKQALMVVLLMPFLYSCVSYNQRMATYYTQLESKQYDKAMRTLDKTKIIKSDRNKLLY